MNLINLIILFILSSQAFALTLEEERKYDELEGLAFIKALIADKKYQEVVIQFKDVKKSPAELGELHFYLADAQFNLQQYQSAYEALAHGEKYKRPVQYYALWGKSAEKLKKFDDCAGFFRKVQSSDVLSSDWEVYFKCLIKSGNAKEALAMGLNLPLQDPDFFLMSQRTLIAYGLYSYAQEKRNNYLNTCRPIDFYLRLWTEVEKLKTPDLSVLESGHACHPAAVEITSVLVKALFQEGKYHTIAYLFEVLSSEDKLYLKHTAEFYKVAGRNTVADYFFTLGEEQDWFLARSSYFLNQENYAALLTIPFKTGALIKNKDLNYAIAYSNFKYLQLDASRNALGSDSQKNARDLQLDGLIKQCRDLDWLCRP